MFFPCLYNLPSPHDFNLAQLVLTSLRPKDFVESNFKGLNEELRNLLPLIISSGVHCRNFNSAMRRLEDDAQCREKKKERDRKRTSSCRISLMKYLLRIQ